MKRLESEKTEADSALEAAMYVKRSLEAENKKLFNEVDKYKTLYADELTKRSELAEKVRELEETRK